MSNDLNNIYNSYIGKLEKYWLNILNDKSYKRYKKVLDLSHLDGVHIQFYHQPFKYMEKVSPDIIFRNKVLKTFIKLNNLTKKNILLSELVVNAIIKQCDYILDNPGYWVRFGYTETMRDNILDTYKLFISYMQNYLKNYSTVTKCAGLGKTVNGDKLYSFGLRYSTGFDNITPREIQRFGFLRLQYICDIINHKYTSIENAKVEYKNRQSYFNSEGELFVAIKNNLFNSARNCKNWFNSDVTIPALDKIVVRPLPYLKSMWGPIARAYDNIIFINTREWNNISVNMLKRICIHEAIPGHIMERTNTKKYIKSHAENKKAIKYLNRGIGGTKEGWAAFVEDFDNADGKNELFNLFNQLLNIVRIIVDVGLNTNDCDKTFTEIEAKNFIGKYSVLNGNGIESEILRYLARPGQACTYGLGYYSIKLLFKESGFTQKKFNDIFMKLPLTIPLFGELIKDIKNIEINVA